MNKLLPVAIIGGVVLCAGAYWAGAHFGIPGAGQRMFTADDQARVMRFQNGARPRGNMRTAAGFGAGEVIAMDDKSITIKLADGGSKIIFLTDQTPVMKSTTGARTDIAVGTNVMVNGKPNQDGSLNAESIQIRPLPPANKTVE